MCVCALMRGSAEGNACVRVSLCALMNKPPLESGKGGFAEDNAIVCVCVYVCL